MSRARKTRNERNPLGVAFAVFSTITSSRMRYDAAKTLEAGPMTLNELQKQKDFPVTSVYRVLQDFVERGIAYQSRQGINVFYIPSAATEFVISSIEELASDFKNEYLKKFDEIHNADLAPELKEGIIQALHDGAFEVSLEKAIEAFYAGSEMRRYEILKAVSQPGLSFRQLYKNVNEKISTPQSSLSNMVASLQKAGLASGDARNGYVLKPAGKYVINAVDTLAVRLVANLIEEKMAILKRGNPTVEILAAYESFLKSCYSN